MKSPEVDSQEIIELASTVLEEGTSSTQFCEMLKWALTRKAASSFWVTLPLRCCEAAGGRREVGMLIAAALHVAASAASILDDVQDADTEDALWQTVGPAQAMNIGVALAWGAPALINRLQELAIPPQTILRLHEECHRTVFTMCGGQHEDLGSRWAKNVPTLEEYWRATAAKTASLFAWGCRAGASLGSASHRALDAYEAYGYHVGLLDQSLNDLEALYGVRGKLDFGDRQWNLLYVYALTVAPAELQAQVQTIWKAAGLDTEAARAEARSLLFQLGAPHYLRIVVEEHYQKAQQALQNTQGEPTALIHLRRGLQKVAYLVERLDRQGDSHGLVA